MRRCRCSSGSFWPALTSRRKALRRRGKVPGRNGENAKRGSGRELRKRERGRKRESDKKQWADVTRLRAAGGLPIPPVRFAFSRTFAFSPFPVGPFLHRQSA